MVIIQFHSLGYFDELNTFKSPEYHKDLNNNPLVYCLIICTKPEEMAKESLKVDRGQEGQGIIGHLKRKVLVTLSIGLYLLPQNLDTNIAQ